MKALSSRIATGAALSAFASLATLHLLRRDLYPPAHMISEYAVGPYGWVMTLCFASFAVSTGSVLAALAPEARTRLARVGLGFLFLATVGLVLGTVFSTDPPATPRDAMSFAGRMHGVGFMIGVPGELLAVLLLSLWLRTDRRLITVASGVWLSLFVTVPLLGAGHGFGIPNRTFMAFYAAWLALAANAKTVPAPGLSGGAGLVQSGGPLRRAASTSLPRR